MQMPADKKGWKLGVAGLALAVATAGALLSAAYGDQPHMHKALDHLRAARTQLELASPHKGGHRVNAIRLIDQAINEVHLGIEYARTHRH